MRGLKILDMYGVIFLVSLRFIDIKYVVIIVRVVVLNKIILLK